MSSIQKLVVTARVAAAFATLILGANTARSATVVYFSAFTAGTGQQVTYAPTTPVSGTMVALVPLFNPALGTLLQADFEFAGNINGSWTSLPATSGVSTFNLSGPADVNGQPMGNIPVSFTGPYVDFMPSSDFSTNFANLTVTPGIFFNTLTGVGTIPLNWNYSGTTSLSTPAVGTFDWGGSAHVLYTYEPVPEPGTLALAGLGLVGLIAVARLRRRR